MKLTFLGTGTSQGIPMVGCKCKVCLSTNPKDTRLRTAAMITYNEKNYVIDIGPDFRQQMLQSNVDDIEAILVTHEHNDHIIGIDDVRPFNFIHRKSINIYSNDRVLAEIKERFQYVFRDNPYPGSPVVGRNEITAFESFQINDLKIIPFQVFHGELPILGFRFGDIVYITDGKTIPDESKEIIKGAKIMVLNALHKRSHHSHFNLQEAIDFGNEMKIPQIYLTHISHNFGEYDIESELLPTHVKLAYDGLEVFA